MNRRNSNEDHYNVKVKEYNNVRVTANGGNFKF